MAAIPQISADSISSLGDPWVAEAHKRRVQSIVQGAGGDYRKAAMALMSIDPAAAQQLSRMAMHQQSLGQSARHHADDVRLRERGLDIQQSAEDKPQVREDPSTGEEYIVRPSSGQKRWLTGPRAGEVEQGPPIPRVMPGQSIPRPQSSVPAAVPKVAAAAPQPSQPDIGAGQVEVAPGVTVGEDEIETLRQNPQYASKFEQHYRLPPGTAQRLINGAKRSEVEPSTTMPGGSIQRVAGAESDLTPDVAQAFAQPTGVDLAPTRSDAPQLPMKSQREIEVARQKEYYRKQADTQIKDIEAAKAIEPYLPAARTAQRLFREAAKTGNIHPIWGNPLVTSGLKYARGALDVLGAGDNNPIQSPLITDPLRSALTELELMRAQAMKGQGQITEPEREILRKSLPSLDAANPQEALQRVEELMSVFEMIARRGELAKRQGGQQ